ncbi:MAG TPA: hypothetical protein VM818_05790 [Vicinamibacterales bacterium]|jgi:hypothetical protein|nr:hypothetical protein [Vicinamibacterales bacterium]
MRDRLLIRHFLWRFLEHDLISPNADRHVVLSALGGTLVAVSGFMAFLIATPYVFGNLMPPGMVSLSSLDDRFLFTSASMLVMALVAVAQWDALALDARDTGALGVLPIPLAVIVRTKFAAVALLAIGVAVVWNLTPTFFRFVTVPAKLPVSLVGLVTLTLAHGVVTLAAGAFGFLSVLGLREGMSAIVGPARFRRISAALQAALLVALVTASLLLPGAHAGVARNWLAQGGLAASALPPLWFVGLHETLAGSVIDTLPRTSPPRYYVVAERDATDLYRSLWPRYHELAWVAIAALAIVGVVTTAACMWNSRRLPVPVVRRAHKDGAAGRAWKWIVGHVVARTSLRQAGFFFTLQTLSRQVSQRVALASSLAVGLSLMLITARGQVLGPGHNAGDVTSVPLPLLAGQSLLLASVLSGFRRAVRIPAELRASTTFSLAWAGNLTPYMSGVTLAGWIALVLPTLGGLFIWHATVLGTRLAAFHFGVGLALSALLMETLFLRYRRVPFVSPYIPSSELRPHGVASAAVLVFVSFALAWLRGSPQLQISCGQRLGEDDDLSRVHAEVLDDVVDGLKHGHVVSLNGTRGEQRLGTELAKHGVGLRERGLQPREKLARRELMPLVEFLLTVPLHGSVADAANYPLAHIAAQVQQQVADAVRRFVRPRPDLLVAEMLEALRYFRQVIRQEEPA